MSSFLCPSRTLFLLLTGLSLANCDETEPQLPDSCSTPATVQDLTGLDGCRGKALVLASGERFLPGGPMWAAFNSVNGQKVLINYRRRPDLDTLASVCMAGLRIEVDCIRAADDQGN
jgi:hypothetical protein